MRLPRYERNRVDGCWLEIGEVRAVTDGLLDSTYEERVAEPCIGRERADLVIYWGCDPVTTHPRHIERYAPPRPGRTQCSPTKPSMPT